MLILCPDVEIEQGWLEAVIGLERTAQWSAALFRYKIGENMNLSPSLIWFLVGVAFLIAEILIPGFILIFFTAGCWITGLAILLIEIDLTAQIWVFIVSSLVLLFTLRKYSIKTFKGTTRDKIDDIYAESKIGKTAIVTKEISPGVPGEIKVMGSFWRAVADTAIAQNQIVIIENQDSENGLTFKVKPLQGEKDE